MIKKIIIVSFVICAGLELKAQDLIVTDSGDSLDCQITKVDGNNIYIIFMEDGNEQKAVMPRSMIRYYAVDYKDVWEYDEAVPKKEIKYPRLRVSVGGGIANLIGANPENIQESLIPYVEELKSGNHFAADICFYVKETVGIGVKYSYFATKNSLNSIYVIDSNGIAAYGRLEDNIVIQYIGPAVALRKTMPRGSAHVVSNLSLGLLMYINHATVIDTYLISGKAFAFSGDVGLDFEIGGGVYFGISFGLTLGIIKSLVIEHNGVVETVDLTGLEYSNASRFDLGLGLRYFL